MSSAADRFLQAHPEIDHIDMLLADMNGILRGKKVEGADAAKALADGILLPRSVYGTDVCGDTVDETRLGIATGDRDYPCRPDLSTLRAAPWSSGAQCMVEMLDDTGEVFAASPREVLRRNVVALSRHGLRATVAVELEFYLFRNRLGKDGRPQLLADPVSGQQSRSTQVYSMSDLEAQQPFIATVRDYCQRQQVPASAAVAEYAPGQFEINLAHKPDAVAACDDAMYLKRIVRIAAREHGMLATFMAKPVAGITGSGLHVHVSLCDEEGCNQFAARPELLQAAIGGLQQTMADSMLVLAPHANSYRRFRKGYYVPMSPTWGHNNRSVALRIPAGDEQAQRIEHRVAGADANPYLVVAAVLAGIAHGIDKGCVADDPCEGDASATVPPSLPVDWHGAIGRFAASDWARTHLGTTLHTLLATIKRAEYEHYHAAVPPLDIEWYLQTV